MEINSVLGPIKREDLGIITPHEHIFIDLKASFADRPLKDIENPRTEKVKMEHLGQLQSDPYALLDNLSMDDYDTQLKEIIRFKKAGGGTIVDVTMPGIDRNPKRLAQIAKDSGLNVIMGTGYYVHAYHPEKVKAMTAEELADEMVQEITVGVDGVKAGIIGELGVSEVFTDEEKKVILAAALAYKKTGTSVMVHVNPWTTFGLDAADILLENGVPADRIAICHIDVINNVEYILQLLEKGVYIEFDNFGKQYYVEKAARCVGYDCFVTDVERVKLVKMLVEKGYTKQLLFSCDVCLKNLLRTYGGWGYDHVLTNIVPMMDDFGIDEATIKTIIEDNPADYLLGKE